MAVVVSIAPYRFLPAQIGGQKNIALFYKYMGRHLPLLCVTVRSNNNSLAEHYKAVSFFSDSKLRYINPLNFFRLRRLLRQHQATHLLMEHPYHGWLAVLLKWFCGVKLVIHSHNIEGIRFKTLGKSWWRILWLYEKWTHRQADYNLFITAEDLYYAVQHYGLDRDKCMVVTYGIEWSTAPARDEKKKAQQIIRHRYSIPAENRILLFAGSFNYTPNIDAVKVITGIICPLLQQQNFRYTVLICGPHLSPDMVQEPNTIVTGFVEDISTYFRAADVFLNPVLDGGGIKTKLVEALGNNTNAVSTRAGAIGVNPQLTNTKLEIVDDGNWTGFADAVIRLSANSNDIPPSFYDHFYWGTSTRQAAAFITSASEAKRN